MAGQEHMSLVGRTGPTGIRSGPWLPLFDDLADPLGVGRSSCRGGGGRLARSLRLGPPVTQDMLIGQLEDLEQFQWFVRAHLESGEGTIPRPRRRRPAAAA